MSIPKDMGLLSFGAKEEQWQQLKGYVEACHPGIKSQLGFALGQKTAIAHAVLHNNPLGFADEFWGLRTDLHKVLKRKLDATSEARKFLDCVDQ